MIKKGDTAQDNNNRSKNFPIVAIGEFEQINLNKLLADVLTDFELVIAQKNASIHLNEMPEIEGLPQQLEQLFHNLLSNALKFAKDDVPPVINISAEKLGDEMIAKNGNLKPGKAYLNIKVKDNGIGIDEKYSDQIFILFQRLNEKQKFPGSGIGLALCKKIVSTHGGDIKVVSKRGQGTEFQVILPVSQNHVAVANNAAQDN